MAVQENNISENLKFKSRKSYTPEEILSAGGTSAFGRKQGQSNEKMIEALESAGEIEPFSKDEWNKTIKYLSESK